MKNIKNKYIIIATILILLLIVLVFYMYPFADGVKTDIEKNEVLKDSTTITIDK